MDSLKKVPKFLVILILTLHLCHQKQVYHERMEDGTYIVAASHKLAKDEKSLRHELGKYFHLPSHQTRSNPFHENIDFDTYPRTSDPVDMSQSSDKSMLLKLKNLCVGQKESTGKQKLQAFKNGPCSPVVIVPGILATSLILQIDCEKLKNYDNGRIFSSCGWDTCSMLGINKPDEQYLLWVGIQVTFKVTGGHSKCFGDIFGLLYDKNSTSDKFSNRYSKPAGLKSTWFGNTASSKPYSRCGANAIRDLGGYVSLLSVMGSQCALKDYGRMIDMLEAMGYESGLTMQPLPYDFRYGILASDTPKLFPQIINNLYYTTGKKVVVVAHSLGTLHTLSALSFHVSEEMKEQMIRHYIPITPPWFGTVSAIRNMLYGDPSYFTKSLVNTGINKYAQMKFSTVSGSTYDLFLRDAFKIYRDEPWMKEILARIQYEKQGRTKNITYGDNPDLENGEQSYPLSWFPSKYQKCFNDFFKANPYCETGLIDFLETPIFEIKGTKYYGSEESMTQLITDNLSPQAAQEALSLWNQTKVKGKSLRTIPAPGVNTSMIFTTLYKTQNYYKYTHRPTDVELDDNSFIEPTLIGNTSGDISVPSYSPLIFVSKWIHDNSNGNHSVNVIEYCANYKGKSKIYSTLPCECSNNPFKNQLDCTHPCIISDKHIIAFVLGILTNSMKGYPDQNLQDAVGLSDTDIEDRITNCRNLSPHSYIK